jgi:hypothetical protein
MTQARACCELAAGVCEVTFSYRLLRNEII